MVNVNTSTKYMFKYATSLEQALKMKGEPSPKCTLDKLLQAFPKTKTFEKP